MKKNITAISAWICLLLVTSCNSQLTHISNDPSDQHRLDQRDSNVIRKVATRATPNILLIIADDMGRDAIKGYQEGSIKPNTPNLDAIRENGLLFTNFWVNPECSPTRGTTITGKYGYRTGVKKVGDVLNSSELVLQKYININTNNKYATAVVGKWHLSGDSSTFNPESFGIDYYAGLIRGSVSDYYRWPLSEDGTAKLQNSYITEKFTDLAIDWVKNQTKPWFLWLAYSAPHTPFHVPPGNMHSQGALPQYNAGMDALPYYMAAIEAMDFQIGRLLVSLTADQRENTVIFFIGDNGTPQQVIQSPYSRAKAKSTLYQGGINVPMFVSGKGILRRGTDANILNGTDLFATISHTAGISVTDYQDSKSFKYLFSKPGVIRTFQYSEFADGSDEQWTISDGSYKLFKTNTGSEQFYHLTKDPYELNDLLKGTLDTTQQNAKLQLETQLAKIRN